MNKNLRIIISGGGTGGHIFPAVSIANAIKELRPDTEILFVGAEGRMEMHRVPAAGYPIKGLPVAGFDRKNLLKNIPVLIKLFKSQQLARKIVKDFQPHAAVGVGGYASGPTLKVAGSMGVPTLLQEQNSYAGVTNKLLAKKAKKLIGVEIVPEAIETAKESALENNVNNTEFLVGACEDVLPKLLAKGEKPDVLVVDPPRAGCEETLLQAISDAQIKKIVYVSCNPATLARDIKSLSEKGYRCSDVIFVDMFCHTKHIESVVCLSK